MSKTNQVCITCTQRDSCQYYDPNRTICVPVNTSDYGQFAGSLQSTIDWQQVRIKASIAAMQAHISDGEHMEMISRNLKCDDEAVTKLVAKASVMYADALIAELKGGEE